MTPKIELICIGTELLSGKVNTHTSWIGPKLSSAGFTLRGDHTVGDDFKTMERQFRAVLKENDVVISAGGLGPTFDDFTREVWSKVLKRPLQFHPDLLSDISAKFKSRGLVMPPHNKRQAYVLRGAEVIPNANGTAPGQRIRIGKKWVVLLPGPARELYPMFESVVLPTLKSTFSNLSSREKSFHLFGIPESTIDQEVRPLVKKYARCAGCAVTHGILASQAVITVKFRVDGKSSRQVDRAYDTVSRVFRKKLGSRVFSEDNRPFEAVVGKLLAQRGATVATAESCTGGLIAKLFTDQPGSSAYFADGVVTYSNASKINRLGVKPTSLKIFGAVSSQVAREMALGARGTAKATYAISVTGIAGPDGGTLEKPVGLVYIGIATPQRVVVNRFQFKGDRASIRLRSALTAFELLRLELLKRERG